MTRPLPAKPHIDHIRKEAKRLLRAHSEADPGCCQVLRHLHHLKDKTDRQILATPTRLTEVQFALAMEYGFESWNRLVSHVNQVESIDPNLQDHMTSRPDELRRAILDMTGAHDIRWTPGIKDGRVRWNGMEFMRSGGKMLNEWDRLWADQPDPPTWDAMCRIRPGSSSWTRLYVWATSSVHAIVGSARAVDGSQLERLHVAIDDAKHALRADPTADWLSGYFPYAKRLAVLGFLIANKSCGHLLFVHFYARSAVGDQAHSTRPEWDRELSQVRSNIETTDNKVLTNRFHTLFLPIVAAK
jgi:hypothetical protein